MKKTLGLNLSKMDGTEHVFGASAPITERIPAHYSYKRYLPSAQNQGSQPYCVPYSVSAFLNWRENMKTKSKKDNKIEYAEIYGSKNSVGEGMTFKEAFSYLRHHGVSSKLGNLKIEEYSKVGSAILLKVALIMNGPCFGALPVYNYSKSFWKKYNGEELLGYHAIAIVGYDAKGFIIRNSWGTSYAESGYTHIPENEMNYFLELWTISE